MNYNNPELVDRLASEYVLGTLRGTARRRFDRLLAERADVRAAVWRWEARLGELAAQVEPQQPPASSWQDIEGRLFAGRARARASGWLWKIWGAAATALSLVLAVLLVQTGGLQDPVSQPDHVAIVGDASEPLWLISADLESGLLSARAVNAEAAEVDRVFELWMLPTDGAPQSIGLLPVAGGEVEHVLPAGLLALLQQSKGLAISLEPPGGSPSGLPTGPIVATAKVHEL